MDIPDLIFENQFNPKFVEIVTYLLPENIITKAKHFYASTLSKYE